MKGKYVTEFSVLVPAELASQSREIMARFKAHLELQFPGYTFSIAAVVRMVDSNEMLGIQDFLVVPNLGSVGDGTYLDLKQMPDRDLVNEIIQECRRYSFDKRAGLAA